MHQHILHKMSVYFVLACFLANMPAAGSLATLNRETKGDGADPFSAISQSGIELYLYYAGNNKVDLGWLDGYMEGNCTYTLTKNNVTILTFDTATYRNRYLDTDVMKGNTYSYKISKTNGTATAVSNSVSALIGRVGGSRMQCDDVWTKASSPYILTDDYDEDGLTVYGNLTIEPGVDIYFESKRQSSHVFGIFVLESPYGNRGTLKAKGTERYPINFYGALNCETHRKGTISVIDDLVTSPPITQSKCVLEYCNFDGMYCGIDTYKNSPFIAHCRIENCTYGIECRVSSAPIIEDNIICNNTVGIRCNKSTLSPYIKKNLIYSNKVAGLTGPLSGAVIDATDNWWGNNTGPRHLILNPNGTGGNITGNVKFIPWWNYTDLTVVNLQVLQVIENGSLVAEKPTAVRVWVDSLGYALPEVEVELFVDGESAGIVKNSVRASIKDYKNVELWQCKETFNFFLDGLQAGTHKIKAVVDPDGKIDEADEENNEKEITVQTRPTKMIRALFKPVYFPLTPYPVNIYPFMDEAVSFFADTYPIVPSNFHSKLVPAEKFWTIPIPFDFDIFDMNYIATQYMKKLIIYNLLNEPNYDFFVGVLSKDYMGTVTGASFAGRRCAPLVSDAAPPALAHEIAHYYGLCLNSYIFFSGEEYDVNPPLGNKLGNTTIFSASQKKLEYVFPAGTYTPGTETYCFMGAANTNVRYKNWVDLDCYNKLFNALAVKNGKTSPKPSYTTEMLILSGSVHRNGTLYVDPFYRVNGSPAEFDVTEDPGDYIVECRASNGTVLANTSFKAYFGGRNWYSFLVTLPCPNGTEKLVFRYRNLTLKEIVQSRNSPAVSINSVSALPNGSFEIRWSGSDADGDKIRYSLFYSPNGGSNWEPVAEELEATTYVFNHSEYPGGNNCIFRVIASDGFNAGSAASEPVTVSRKVPIVKITAPVDGTSFSTGARIELRGAAHDAEDDTIQPVYFNWTSAEDGFLGTGSILTISSFGEGNHTITLTVNDTDGNKASQTITIYVLNDTQPPEITTVEVSPQVAYSGQKIWFKLNVTDNVRIPDDGVMGEMDTHKFALELNLTSGFYEGSINYTLNPGQHYVHLTAVDSAGLSATITKRLEITPNHAPAVYIISPYEGQHFASGETVRFEANATDEEDGVLDTTSVVWISSRDGIIGYGKAVNTSSLSEGPHTIRLSVRDGGGLTVQCDINLLIFHQGELEKVSGLKITEVNTGRITISWLPSEISDFLEYRIYISRNQFTSVHGMSPFTAISERNATTCTLAGLEKGMTYHFAVTVVDADGTENPEVNAVSATTPDEGLSQIMPSSAESSLAFWFFVASMAILVGSIGCAAWILRTPRGGKKNE
ncbi:MAG: fibronectin type III domain-containing protein [Thermoplasmata archaeon]|nr:fibronectin type III domain-containing protein [Thermoplasmata archaeon]